MQVVNWVLSVLAFVINAYAVVALVLGLRSRDAGAIGRYARRCRVSVAAYAVLVSAVLAASLLTIEVPRGGVGSERAFLLGRLLSEVMNDVAFLAVTAALPSVVAMVLYRRARQVV